MSEWTGSGNLCTNDFSFKLNKYQMYKQKSNIHAKSVTDHKVISANGFSTVP